MRHTPKRAKNDLLADIRTEMAAPRMSQSAQKAEQDLDITGTAEKPSATMVGIIDEPEELSDHPPRVKMQGTVEKIIPGIGDLVPEKVQIAVEGGEPLYREIRIDNVLQTGNRVTSLEVGSKVEVTIQAHPSHPASSQIGVVSPHDQSATRSIRILIADDHPTIRQMVKLILTGRASFEVVGEARDGQEAVTLAESLKPDVVVINVTMPNMSGFEAARRIRAHFPNCAIVILSSNKDRQFVEEARKIGANGYVDKSSADAQLILAIESAVKGKEFYYVE